MELNSSGYFLSTLVPPNFSLKRFGTSLIPSRRRWWWNPAAPAQNMSTASQTYCHTLKTHLLLLRGKACSSAAASSGSFMINPLYPCYNPATGVCDAPEGGAKPDCCFCIWMQTTRHQVSTSIIISNLSYLCDRIKPCGGLISLSP